MNVLTIDGYSLVGFLFLSSFTATTTLPPPASSLPSECADEWLKDADSSRPFSQISDLEMKPMTDLKKVVSSYAEKEKWKLSEDELLSSWHPVGEIRNADNDTFVVGYVDHFGVHKETWLLARKQGKKYIAYDILTIAMRNNSTSYEVSLNRIYLETIEGAAARFLRIQLQEKNKDVFDYGSSVMITTTFLDYIYMISESGKVIPVAHKLPEKISCTSGPTSRHEGTAPPPLTWSLKVDFPTPDRMVIKPATKTIATIQRPWIGEHPLIEKK